MRNAARIVEIAFAPMAGANGGELLLAPRAHAVNSPVSVATTTSAQNSIPVVIGVPALRTLRRSSQVTHGSRRRFVAGGRES
jgi:hypothetical protein